jgi:hypothetical protein
VVQDENLGNSCSECQKRSPSNGFNSYFDQLNVRVRAILAQAVKVAAINDHAEVVRLLATYTGLEIECAPYLLRPLHVAVRSGSRHVVNALFEMKASLKLAENTRGYNEPLQAAIMYGGWRMVQLLVSSCGLDVRRRDNVTGSYPLVLAIQHKMYRAAKLLVAAKAAVDVLHGALRETPLSMALRKYAEHACFYSSAPFVAFSLMENSLHNGTTTTAKYNGNQPLIVGRGLDLNRGLGRGLDLNRGLERGLERNWRFFKAERDGRNTIKLLLHAKADVTTRNIHAERPMDLARNVPVESAGWLMSVL